MSEVFFGKDALKVGHLIRRVIELSGQCDGKQKDAKFCLKETRKNRVRVIIITIKLRGYFQKKI